MECFDVLVIGGGPAGSTAAIRLAQAGWKVALAERKEFPRRKVCGEYLSATNWPLLGALGLDAEFFRLAGPEVHRTAVFCGKQMTQAPLPRPERKLAMWGRALSREALDSLLLDRARREGVAVYQPFRCVHLAAREDGHSCRLHKAHGDAATEVELSARVVIAAHGSWEPGPLRTERQPFSARAEDWLAFKAHFRNVNLPGDLMPLLSFPGGYGGMVRCDNGQTSLSFCVRRKRLARLDRSFGISAGEAAFAHLLNSTPALAEVFRQAKLEESWMAAGPIQPGQRRCFADGLFVVGNAAGEAHPVVAEGISMAMQASWLLTELLNRARASLYRASVREQVGREYQRQWRKAFTPRILAASAIAHWASHPVLVQAAMPFLRTIPSALTLGARASGKAWVVARSNTYSGPSALSS